MQIISALDMAALPPPETSDPGQLQSFFNHWTEKKLESHNKYVKDNGIKFAPLVLIETIVCNKLWVSFNA